MSAPSTTSFTQSGVALFTPEEIHELMRVEFERAKRYGYAVACMMIMVDRLEQLHAVHGYEAKMEIIDSVIGVVKKETRASDFIGCLVGDRVLALFPHTDPGVAGFLAERLLAGARKLVFDVGGRTLRITISIGLSHNRHPDAGCFETLVQVAEEGLNVADAGGGDRYVETELYQLYEARRARHPVPLERPSSLEDGGRAFMGGSVDEERRTEEASAPEAKPRVEDLLRQDAGGGMYRARLKEILAEEDDLEVAVQRLAEEILAETEEEARARDDQRPQSKEEQYLREIDILERRVNKLNESLGMTEEELNRVRRMKGIDPGISSIYREVQGLSFEDPKSALKLELMERIFEANLDLRGRRGEAG